ncbi:MAG: helix-turn-helix domain-containing protein [Limisphaerales bacterium]
MRFVLQNGPLHQFYHAAILDYSNVNVKRYFLPDYGVPGIGHYESIRKEIIRLLQNERERRHLSNYAVAQRSGVSESMLSLVERGLRNPTMELMLRIADGVGANLPALIEKATRTVVRGKNRKAVVPTAPARLRT